MFNVQIAGRLGKDPETRFTPSGKKVTNFNIAVNQRKGKEDVTIWVRVSVWGDHLDNIVSLLKTGSAVIVTGRMNAPSTYVDKEGRTQISVEVTAAMIEFSPFGRSDRPEETASQEQNRHSYGEESGLSHASAGYSGRQNAYSAGTMSGQNSHSHTIDDDALPF